MPAECFPPWPLVRAGVLHHFLSTSIQHPLTRRLQKDWLSSTAIRPWTGARLLPGSREQPGTRMVPTLTRDVGHHLRPNAVRFGAGWCVPDRPGGNCYQPGAINGAGTGKRGSWRACANAHIEHRSQHPSTGYSLDMTRTFVNTIPGRYQSEAFGYGWSFLGDDSVTTDPTTGTVYIQQDGVQRVFTLQPDGTYQGAAGDAATLTLNRTSASGSSWPGGHWIVHAPGNGWQC